MSGITTHVLDTSVGRPAGGVAVRLLRDEVELAAGTTDDDGRWVALGGDATTAGDYQLSRSRPATTSVARRSTRRSPSTSPSATLPSTTTSRCCSRRSATPPTAAADVAAHLGPNRYGKDGIRLVLVSRPEGDDGAHMLRDLTVDVRLEGDFETVHTEGDNSSVLPTDTMRSTVYALAQHHLTGSIEAFGLALTERFLAASPAASVAEVTLREHSWGRAQVEGSAHPHTFVGGSAECATAVVTRTSTSGPRCAAASAD